jgi:DegV family protein with EDD domain
LDGAGVGDILFFFGGNMQIVTDRGCDFSQEQLTNMKIHFVPMRLTLDGKTYSSGDEISPEAFYDLLTTTESFPTTSQATVGDFENLYRELAKEDPDILSIHISSGLSGTINSAKAAAANVPEANVTIVDTKTLSCAEAWQVEAAYHAVQAGIPLDKILPMLSQIGKKTEGMFTLDTLKYLIHGGRISHLKGLLASMLNIKPVIGVEKEFGKYYTLAQEITMKRAIRKLGQVLTRFFPEGSKLRVQMVHGKNPEGIELLRDSLLSLFQVHWMPTLSVAPILGAHTGAGVVGVIAGPQELFGQGEAK